MDIFVGYWPDIVLWLVLIFILIMQFRRPVTTPVKEKIAYTTRLLMNLQPIALILITDAEIQFAGKSGKFKRSWVIDELYKRVPDEYKKYVVVDNLDAIINIVLPQAESLWADNPLFLQPFMMGGRE